MHVTGLLSREDIHACLYHTQALTHVPSSLFKFVHFRGFTFYKMTNLDNRIANADQLLTQVCNNSVTSRPEPGALHGVEGGREGGHCNVLC